MGFNRGAGKGFFSETKKLNDVPIFTILSQSERGYAGLAAVERSNPAFGLSIRSLNCQLDATVSRKPEFKKAIFQGGDGLID